MAEPIVCYFDFVSPHSYIAMPAIEEVAARHGRALDWRAVSVFQIWDAIDYHPIGKPKAKARYVRRDFERCAAVAGLPFAMPKPFPLDCVLARQAAWRLQQNQPETAPAFMRAVFHRYWGEGQDISTAEQIAASTAAIGVDLDLLQAAESDPEAAAGVRANSEQAVADGAFGVPYFLVDGEPFWGQDRIGHIDWRLANPIAAAG
ncbi:MAG: 2-hydroxychromene-2-carboxylate isomerase [Alphaproteobacteria bacterium]|nr:2-hydroxychromene-2-carboxylate isomerase [Alphaproteobacteria bacterium]